tara:strand:- start:221 stop:1747 length:1527 start_codon:yes stop_codon:yes gene_type:complete
MAKKPTLRRTKGGWRIPDTVAKKELLRNKITELIKEAKAKGLDSNQTREFIGPLFVGDQEFGLNSVSKALRSDGKGWSFNDYSRSRGTKNKRRLDLKAQTSLNFPSAYNSAARKAMRLAGQQDHHILFRTLFAPFYEGMDDFEARQLTEFLVQENLPLGNISRNLTLLDEDLHDYIHGWAIENQIQVSPDKTGKGNFITDAKGNTFVRGSGESAVNAVMTRSGIDGLPELPTDPKARQAAIGSRFTEAALYGDLIQEPLLDETAKVVTRQEYRTLGKKGRSKKRILNDWYTESRNLSKVSAMSQDWGFTGNDIRRMVGANYENIDVLEGSMGNIGKLRGVKKAASALGTGDAFAQSALAFSRGDVAGGMIAGTLASAQMAGQSPAVQKRFAALTAELVAKRGSKTALKAIPGLDIALSGAETWSYITEGKWDQAGIAALSGAIGWVPGVGDLGAALLDATNTGIDIARADFNKKGDIADQPESKIRSTVGADTGFDVKTYSRINKFAF